MISHIEQLFSDYFSNQDSSFYVIYDSFAVFKDIIDQLQLPGFEILLIDSSYSPNELLDRKKIVNSFDEESGWYTTKWIIYIFGDYVQKVEDTQLFLYYANLDISFHFHSIWDILLEGKFKIASSKSWNYDFENDPQLNSTFSSLLSGIPISCFISKKGAIEESGFWMTFLKSFQEIGDTTDFSPIFFHHKTDTNLFDVESVLLELIYSYSPTEFQLPSKEPFNHFNTIFNYVNREFDNFFTFTDDFNNNMLVLIHSFFHSALPTKTKSRKKKIQGLQEFFTASSSLKSVLRKKILNIFNFWVSNQDQIMNQRFLTWTEIIRNKSKLIISTQDQFDQTTKTFSYSGEIDLALIKYLLSTIKASSSSLDQWQVSISKTIIIRKNLWSQFASTWWNQQPLFVHQSNQTSLKQLWIIIENIGIILLIKMNSLEKWSIAKEIVWLVESAYQKLLSANIDFFNQVTSLSFISAYIYESLEKFHDFRPKINASFVRAYFKNDFFSNYKPTFNIASELFSEAINALESNTKIGFFFIDALRSDIALSLHESLTNKMKESKGLIESSSTLLHDAYTLIPSITGLGWPLILSHNAEITFLPQNNSPTIQLAEESKSFVLRSPDDRNKRIQSILSKSIDNIHIEEINQSDISSSLKSIKNHLLNSSRITIPVLWYRKFDNHKKTEKEFLEDLPKELHAISDCILQLHHLEIQKIFIFTDHGFIFAKNTDIIKDIPSTETNHRYSVSPDSINSFNPKKYPDWLLWSPKLTPLPIKSNKDFTIICPTGFSIFKKLRQNERFVHGGLSYLECNVKFLVSTINLLPKVQIVSIDLIDHKTEIDFSGKELIILNDSPDGYKLLEFKITGSESSSKEKKLKITKLKVQIDHPDCKISPKELNSLKAGSSIKYKCYLKNLPSEKLLTISFLDENNNIIKYHEITVKSTLYSIGI